MKEEYKDLREKKQNYLGRFKVCGIIGQIPIFTVLENKYDFTLVALVRMVTWRCLVYRLDYFLTKSSKCYYDQKNNSFFFNFKAMLTMLNIS